MHLWLRDTLEQRTLLLITSNEDEQRGCPGRALVLRAGRPSQAIVEFLLKADVDREGLTRLSQRQIEGCLGLISVDHGEQAALVTYECPEYFPIDIFLAVVTSSTKVGNMRPSALHPESVCKIQDVEFFCLNSSRYDTPSEESPTTPLHFDGTDSVMGKEQLSYNAYLAPAPNTVYEHPCAPLRKIMSSGTFYYSPYPYWDLSTRFSERLARRRRGQLTFDMATYDPRFIWNEFIVRPLIDFRERLSFEERSDMDQCLFIILAIQGYAGVFDVPLTALPTSGAPVIGSIALISRLGWKRAGTRFNTRGMDDEGNVANFVETETVFSTSEVTFSYVQVRGSVPLFWEQQGVQTFGHRIQITRPQQASLPAFERHFAQLVDEYKAVHAINLLGQKEGETTLTAAYSQYLRATQRGTSEHIALTNYDFHNAVKAIGHDGLVSAFPRVATIRPAIEQYGFTSATYDSDEPVMEQCGVFRTNCLDCLDRTNFVQDILSRSTLELFLDNVDPTWSSSSILWAYHREMWAENGDSLSRMYAGTGALNTSYTRTGKRTLAGVLSDATKSVSRAYINNFQDKGKQSAIDLLVGNMSTQTPVLIFDPIHDSIRMALKDRQSEYSKRSAIRLFVGTWNVNGRPPSEGLGPWLFPSADKAKNPDIFVIGFQEIVPLNAQQIIQADPAKKEEWEIALRRTLKDGLPKEEYVFLRSEQLVGTALFVIVNSRLIPTVKNVSAASRKTGLRGMSGNKGAVAIRLECHDTSFCFLTAHLAAGHSNVEERNNDYRTIDEGLRFPKGRTIGSHDVVIWAADTNYRIDLENEQVRSLAMAGELESLVEHDQLTDIMNGSSAFASYKEGPLRFQPTYRYDLHSTEYDTSEKMRIPAWTDRILYRGLAVQHSHYGRAELMGSDHRPVFAIFNCDVLIIDPGKREALQSQMLTALTSTGPGERLEEKIARVVLHEDREELPPPSSAEFCWWDGPEHPDGVFRPETTSALFSTNPFDSDVSSTSSSEEELYRQASLKPDLLST